MRPVKYKDISYRLLGEDSWKLSHSVCSGFALFCTHLVLPMVGDWILGEMDILADLIVILVYFGILFSGKMQMEKRAEKYRYFISEQRCCLDFVLGICSAEWV